MYQRRLVVHDVLYSTQCHKLPINSLTQSIWYLMVFTLRRKLFLYERHGLFGETKGGGPRYPQNKHVRTIFCTVENTTKSLSLLKL